MHGKEHLKTPSHIKKWCDLWQKNPKLCKLAPRDHLKTTLGQAFALWRVKYHKDRGIIFSVTQPLAKDILKGIKADINHNPKFMDLKPKNHLESWTQTEIEIDRYHKIDINEKCFLKCKGYGSATRGPHPDFVILDDIYGDKKNKTTFTHEFIIDFFKTAVTNMVREGHIKIIGTKFDLNDLYGWLEKNKKYVFKKFVAIIDEDRKEVLWPEIYSFEKLLDRREEIGDLAFNQEFQNEVVDDTTSLFPIKGFLDGCGNDEADLIKNPRRGQNYLLSVDPGFVKGACFMILELNENKKIYLADTEVFDGFDESQHLEKIQNLHKVYNFKAIIVEENSIKGMLKNFEDLRLPIITYNTGSRDVESADKITLDKTGYITRLRLPVKNKVLVFPLKSEEAKKKMLHVWDELNRLRLVEGKIEEVGDHTHTPIVLGAGYEFAQRFFPGRVSIGTPIY